LYPPEYDARTGSTMQRILHTLVIFAGLIAALVSPHDRAQAAAALPVEKEAAPAAATGEGQRPRVEITVYAAASLRDALGVVAATCEPATGTRLVFNFAASNDLARQIVAANKADIYFSADEAWMDHVANAGLVDMPSRKAFLSNRLVVVARADSNLKVSAAADLAQEAIHHLALANPDAVPAGKYAKAWLEKAGVWDKVRDRVVPGIDVRATLATVEAGAADAGIVYRTDAAIAKRARVLYTVPEAEGPRIVYPVALLGQRPHLDVARQVLDCFEADAAGDTFERMGFMVVERSAAP
jgi:molybdate transport system substrate-binding protein